MNRLLLVAGFLVTTIVANAAPPSKPASSPPKTYASAQWVPAKRTVAPSPTASTPASSKPTAPAQSAAKPSPVASAPPPAAARSTESRGSTTSAPAPMGRSAALAQGVETTSPRLQALIRQRQSDPLDGLTEAWILAQLQQAQSQRDREWLAQQQRLVAAAARPARPPAPDLPSPPAPQHPRPREHVAFEGVSGQHATGVPIRVVATASRAMGSVSCEAEPPVHDDDESPSVLQWTPKDAGVILISCVADGYRFQRLIHVGATANSR